MKTAIVPTEIHTLEPASRQALRVWNESMAEYETLEMVWPKLVKAMQIESKPTEGPWKNYGCAVYSREQWQGGDDYGSRPIATTDYLRGDEMPTEEDWANARLIAAAPDLLAALQRILERDPDALDAAAVDAIAKATA